MAFAETASSFALKAQQTHSSPAEIFNKTTKSTTPIAGAMQPKGDSKLQSSATLGQPRQFARSVDGQYAGGYGQRIQNVHEGWGKVVANSAVERNEGLAMLLVLTNVQHS